jgi:hypothetical protein
MAYYDALIAAWNNGTQPPPGVTGQALTGLTTAQKLAAVQAWTVASGVGGKAILSPSAILNAVVFADLAALTQLQVSQLSLLLAGNQVDASVGTSIRAGIQALFAGKTQTLNNLGALVAPLDAQPQISWMQKNGYAALSINDIAAAGLS